MQRPFTLLLLVGLSGSIGLAGPADDRVSGDDTTTQDPRFADLNYYIDPDDRFAPQSSGDSDLGEQRLLAPPSTAGRLYGAAETFFLWSNNLANTESATEEGWAAGAILGVRWRKPLVKDLLFDAYGYQDVYRYDVDGLDFESTELGAGVMKFFPRLGDLVAIGRYEFIYLHAEDPTDDIHTRLHRARVGLGKTLFQRPDHLIYASVNSGYDFDADPAGIKRFQQTARVSWSWRITQRLRGTLFYRLSHRDYLNSSREDWHQSAGAELSLAVTDWAKLYASTHYSHNDSNQAGESYDSFEAGLAAGFSGKF